MAHTNSWDETSPTDSTNATSIDDEIRKLRKDTRERLAVDHNLTASDAGAATVGYHKQITFEDDVADPGQAGDITTLYTKKLAGDSAVVPFFEHDAVVGVARILLGDSNFKVPLYTNTAPIGMLVMDEAPTDCVLAVVGGGEEELPWTESVAGTAGDGSWTIDGFSSLAHTHTVDIWASNKTGTILSDGATSRTFLKDSSGANDWSTSAAPGAFASKGKRETTAETTPELTQDAAWRPDGAFVKFYTPDLTV